MYRGLDWRLAPGFTLWFACSPHIARKGVELISLTYFHIITIKTFRLWEIKIMFHVPDETLNRYTGTLRFFQVLWPLYRRTARNFSESHSASIGRRAWNFSKIDSRLRRAPNRKRGPVTWNSITDNIWIVIGSSNERRELHFIIE